MAVTFDAVGPSSAGTGASPGTSLTWSHTVASGPAALVIGFSNGHDAGTDGTVTVTVDGSATGVVATGLIANNNSTSGTTRLYGKPNVATGAHTIVVTVTGGTGTNSTITGGSVSYAGADAVSPFGTPASAFGNGTNPAVALPASAASSMVAVVASSGSPAISLASVQRWADNFSSVNAAGNACQGDKPGGSTGTATFTDSTADFWGALAVEVIAAGSGGPGTPQPPQYAVLKRPSRLIEAYRLVR